MIVGAYKAIGHELRSSWSGSNLLSNFQGQLMFGTSVSENTKQVLLTSCRIGCSSQHRRQKISAVYPDSSNDVRSWLQSYLASVILMLDCFIQFDRLYIERRAMT